MNTKNYIQKVILDLIQDLRRLPLPLLNNLRGRFQIKFGMTALFNNGGFTLIELLVVVLIIGILAAVAVPQYQVAVEKTRAMNRIVLMKAILDAQQRYVLANGTGTDDIDKLDINFPYSSKEDYSNYGKVYRLGKSNYYFLVYQAAHQVVYGNLEKKYSLSVRKNSGFCQPLDNDSFGTKVCKSLGKLKQGTTDQYDF